MMRLICFCLGTLLLTGMWSVPVPAVAGAAVGKMAFRDLVLKVDPALKAHMKSDAWTLDTSYESDGYLSVSGPFEGVVRYFLFRGKPSDLIIKDEQQQSLKLKQNFSFFKVTGTKIENKNKDGLFPKDEIETAYKSGRKFIKDSKDAKTWQEPVEWFDLPVRGKKINLILSSEDPNFYDPQEGLQVVVGALDWTGSKFHLQIERNKKIIKMGQSKGSTP